MTTVRYNGGLNSFLREHDVFHTLSNSYFNTTEMAMHTHFEAFDWSGDNSGF